jgi:Fic family protein
MEGLGFELQAEAVLATLTQNVLKSSEIEGERLPVDQVRSSIARHLGMNIGATAPIDRHVKGVVEMMPGATRRYDASLPRTACSTGAPRCFRPAVAACAG